ncbi:MAG: hypothetical protein AB9866_09105 [Syntrophobacteraceae bacterium]
MKFDRIFLILAIMSIPLIVPLQAAAQLAAIEGPIQDIIPDRRVMVVMGVTVHVPPGIPITSPTANLTELAGAGNPLELMLGANLPGRTVPGFMGGTAIINGTALPSGSMRATDIFVEPSENVLIGAVTASTCTNANCARGNDVLSILKTQVRPISDPRMQFSIVNDFGFSVDLTGANLVGTAAAAEGYFVAPREFRYFLLEITGAPLRNPGIAEVSIQRAQCREDAVNGIQLDVLGATHTPALGTVTISNGGTTFGTESTISTGVGSAFGTYTFRLRDNPAFNSCPENVTASFAGATASSGVDITPE